MSTPEKSFKRMNDLLDQLIITARQLRDAVQQVVSEAELRPLQETQENILQELEKIDKQTPHGAASDVNPEVIEQLYRKLNEFQELNKQFIDNFKSSHGLIDTQAVHEEKD